MKLNFDSVRSASMAMLLFGCLPYAYAESQAGDHSLSLTSDIVGSAGADDHEISDTHRLGSELNFNETFTLFVDKLLRVSAFVAENTGIQEFTSFGLYADNALITQGTVDNGPLASGSLVVADLLPGTYELRVSGILDGVTAGRFDISADAVATPIPTATWFFAPAIATVFGLRKRKGKRLQSV